MRITHALLIGALLALAGLCPPAPAAARGTSAVRVVNAVQAGPSLALHAGAEATPLVAGVAFGQASAYVALSAGPQQLRVTGGAAELTLEADLQPSQHYTLAIVGRAAQADSYLFADSPWPLDGGRRALRLYHLSFDSPALDLRTPGGATVIADVAFGQASDYAPAPADAAFALFPALVAAPQLAGGRLGAGPAQSVFVVGELATIGAFVQDDAPLLERMPASLPNTAGATMPLGRLLSAGLCAAALGAWLRRRSRR